MVQVDKAKKDTVSMKEAFPEYGKDRENRTRVQRMMMYYRALQGLHFLRKELGKTQKELANISGVPRETISKIENGRRNPTLKTVIKLANAMGKRVEIRLVD